MIENLKGIHEIVNYKDNSNIRLYNNTDFEEYPSHWHIPLEIIMPIENTYIVECNNNIFTLNVGDIMIICPGVLHTLHACKGRRIIFQAELLISEHLKELDSIITMISPILLITPETSPELYDTIFSLMNTICSIYEKNAPFSEANIYSKLIEMLVYFGQNHANINFSSDLVPLKNKEYLEKFMRICEYINENCSEDLTLENIAQLAGFSKFHFSRLFKQFTNMSFYKYLTQKRISHAEHLLIDPTFSITDAALQSGFTSISSFIRMFKIIKGCTPTEFRTMYALSTKN